MYMTMRCKILSIDTDEASEHQGDLRIQHYWEI